MGARGGSHGGSRGPMLGRRNRGGCECRDCGNGVRGHKAARRAERAQLARDLRGELCEELAG